MNNYYIELTEKQLRALNLACEVCARIKIGQVGQALNMLALTNSDSKIIGGVEFQRQIDAIVKPLMGLTRDASFGVGKFPDADLLFDLHEVFRHRLAWDKACENGIIKPDEPRKWPEMRTVDYDEPMGWCDEPLAKIIKINE